MQKAETGMTSSGIAESVLLLNPIWNSYNRLWIKRKKGTSDANNWKAGDRKVRALDCATLISDVKNFLEHPKMPRY